MNSPAENLRQNAETYQAKNADYGESWRAAGRIMAEACENAGVDELTVPANPRALASLGLYFRRLDKLLRGFHGEFLTDAPIFESIQDSHDDESTYAAMHSTLLAEMERKRERDIERFYEATYQNLRDHEQGQS